MFTGLHRGLVLKSKNPEEGETIYTIILGKRLFFPWMYKTATLYKDWTEDSPIIKLIINEKDKRNYIRGIKKKKFTSPNEEEWDILNENIQKLSEEQREYLKRNIENIPEKIKKIFYKTLDLELYPHSNLASQYGFEMQNVSKVSSKTESKFESLERKLLEKFYKKALSITQFLPL